MNNYWLDVDEMEVVVKMEGFLKDTASQITMNKETQESIALWFKEHSKFDN